MKVRREVRKIAIIADRAWAEDFLKSRESISEEKRAEEGNADEIKGHRALERRLERKQRKKYRKIRRRAKTIRKAEQRRVEQNASVDLHHAKQLELDGILRMDEAWLREKEDKRRRIDALKTNLGTIKKKTALVFSLIALRTGRIGTLLDRRPKAVGKSAASSLKAPPLERPPWELMREDLVVARSTKKRQLRCDSDPVYRFYNQARFDLRRLVEIRTTWDKYAVPAGSSGATSIPPRWVEPDPPSSDAWAQAVS